MLSVSGHPDSDISAVANGVLIMPVRHRLPNGASIIAPTVVLVAAVGHGTSFRSPGNGSNCVEFSIKANMNSVLVMPGDARVTVLFGFNCSNSSALAVANGTLITPIRHALTDGTSIAVSTSTGAGVNPSGIGADWLPNSLANWTDRSRSGM